MSYEYFAAKQWRSEQELRSLAGDTSIDPASRARLLGGAAGTQQQELARSLYFKLIGQQDYQTRVIKDGAEAVARLRLEGAGEEAIDRLPTGSWRIDFLFRLRKSYLSKHDEVFGVIDNLVLRERIFQLPMVAPSGWKGALRSTAVQQLAAGWLERQGASRPELFKQRAELVLLFGSENKAVAGYLDRCLKRATGGGVQTAEDAHPDFATYLQEHGYLSAGVEGRQGRLFFFPTFFGKVGMEIINPHSRDRRVGRNPIPLECVPAGAEGWFHLLYVPVGGPERAEAQETGLSARLLVLTCKAVCRLMLEDGFGAKTSSGHGRARDALKGEGRLEARLTDGSRAVEGVQKISELNGAGAELGQKLKGGR